MHKLHCVIIIIGICALTNCRQLYKEKPQVDTSHAAQMDVISKHIEKGDISRAQAALDDAFKAQYQHPMAFYLQGRIYLANDDQQGAAKSIAWFEKAIAASPSWIEPRLLLAQACLRDQRLRRAEELFHDIDGLLPRSATGPYGLALIDSLDGFDEKSTAHLEESLKRNPNYGPALLLRAKIAGKNNQHALQRQLYERYLSNNPLHPGVHFSLGELYVKIGRRSDAWRSFSRSYELQADAETARRLAEIAAQNNDIQAQQLWLERAGAGSVKEKIDFLPK